MIIRIAWGIGKFAVKHILVPIAVTAVVAVVLEKLAERVAPQDPNGATASPTMAA